MKTRVLLFPGLALALLAPGPFAQRTPTKAGDEPVVTASALSSDLLKGSELIGMNVQDAKGEDCAEIEDLLVRADGSLAALLLSVEGVDDGFLVILPASAVTARFERDEETAEELDTEERLAPVGELSELMLNVPANALLTAPRVSTAEGDVDALLTEGLISKSYTHFKIKRREGGEAHADAMPEKADHALAQRTSLQRASSLMDRKVKNPAKEELGSIDDLVVSLKDAQVSYAVMNYGGLLGVGAKQFAVPYKAFAHVKDGDTSVLELEVTSKILEGREGFERLPATADRSLFRERAGSPDSQRRSG